MSIKGFAEVKRQRELSRCQNDLYYLACKLGYGWTPSQQQGVTPELHGPLCARMDRLRDYPRVATFTPRKTLKTTVFTICLAVQEILRNPDITGLICHMVEAEAQKILQEIGELFRTNSYLASLEPIGVYPEGHAQAGKPYRVIPRGPGSKKWLKAESFTLNRAGISATTKRQPTMLAKGTGSEITGAHVDIIFPDDIIGQGTIDSGTGMAQVRSWWQKTILNVLNNNGRIRLVGTRWDDQDFYGTSVIDSAGWEVVVRHALEVAEGVLEWDESRKCYVGDPIHFGPGTARVAGGIAAARKREKEAFAEQGRADYAAQRMNDPKPQSEMPWVRSECEHFVGLQKTAELPGASLPGVVIVLSDPAPWKQGGFKSLGEKQRSDGSKDYWSVAVVKLAWNGRRLVRFLIDGARSQEWDDNAGSDVIAQFMRRYRTGYYFSEDADRWWTPMKEACVRAGASAPIADWKTGGPWKYKDYNKANGKNLRFGRLATAASQREFLLSSETCPDEFLHGDSKFTGFLTQARGWRPLPGNRVSLRFDDDGDVVARSMDEAVTALAGSAPSHEDLASKFFGEDAGEDAGVMRSRYCAV